MSKIEAIKYKVDEKIVVLRNGDIDDAEELLEVINRLDYETPFLLREPGELTMTIEQEKMFLQSKIESEVNLFILAEIDGKIIGTCAVNGSTRKRLRHSANLGIAIFKDYCGKGIGRRLMVTSINWAKENGISRITLQVDANNFRAINLYLKLGFEIEGTLKKDKLLSDGTFIDTYTMALLL